MSDEIITISWYNIKCWHQKSPPTPRFCSLSFSLIPRDSLYLSLIHWDDQPRVTSYSSTHGSKFQSIIIVPGFSWLLQKGRSLRLQLLPLPAPCLLLPPCPPHPSPVTPTCAFLPFLSLTHRFHLLPTNWSLPLPTLKPPLLIVLANFKLFGGVPLLFIHLFDKQYIFAISRHFLGCTVTTSCHLLPTSPLYWDLTGSPVKMVLLNSYNPLFHLWILQKPLWTFCTPRLPPRLH